MTKQVSCTVCVSGWVKETVTVDAHPTCSNVPLHWEWAFSLSISLSCNDKKAFDIFVKNEFSNLTLPSPRAELCLVDFASSDNTDTIKGSTIPRF
ncbi:hypothetical protein JTE90_013289 [Oedothorax gibbosus]|uniref:Uncharacterized protein n=1 Tax=Oedothorax gibbosus TaxID=931172 RepID=A0AAV6VED5_9ARAC|nr:hypothetical protein JTE90_013289 [Oedothorax gibbosus]